MSQFIKFYFTSSVLNMFRTLIHPSSGACDFSILSPHWLCDLVSMCVGVSVWLVGVVSVWQAEAQRLLASSCLSVCPCVPTENLAIIEQIFKKFDISRFLKNLLKIFKFY